MFYLINKPVESYRENDDYVSDSDICITKEEKLKYVGASICKSDSFYNILAKLYPELDNYTSDVYATVSGLKNNLLGLVIVQAYIAIIENPNIICTNRPYNNGIKLYKELNLITSVYKIDYNGNYIVVYGENKGNLIYERVLISKTDSEFIPSKPEYIIGDIGVCTHGFLNSFNENIIIKDIEIESFLNKTVGKIKKVYVYLQSNDYLKYIKILKKHWKVVLLIYINDITDYENLKLAMYDCTCIFLDSDTINYTTKYFLASNEINYWSSFIDAKLAKKYPYHTCRLIDFDNYGLINSGGEWRLNNESKRAYGYSTSTIFKELRKSNGLKYYDKNVY